jgi:shikimate 5-dehydrogenase
MNETIYEASQLLSGGDLFKSLAPPAGLCVFGDPVAHSKSPIFQNAALRASGLEMQYVKIHARSEELTPALKSLPARGFTGANITIPHKPAALAMVDEADD